MALLYLAEDFDARVFEVWWSGCGDRRRVGIYFSMKADWCAAAPIGSLIRNHGQDLRVDRDQDSVSRWSTYVYLTDAVCHKIDAH